MNPPAGKHKWTSYLFPLLGILILVPLVVWNVREIRSCSAVAQEHARWQAIDEIEKSRIKELRSWEERAMSAIKEDRLERSRQRRFYKAALVKKDFFPLHPGQYYGHFFRKPNYSGLNSCFYLPPGEHKLLASVIKVTREDGEAIDLSHENYKNPTAAHVTEMLSEEEFLLTGGQVHEFVLDRKLTDTGCTLTGTLNGDLLAKTELPPAESKRFICGFGGNHYLDTPYPIKSVNVSGKFGPDSIRQNPEFEIVMQFPKEESLPGLDCRYDFKDKAGRKVQVYFRFHLELEGGPRANILEYEFWRSVNSFLSNTPFDFDEWFEHQDGLYRLRPEAQQGQ